MIPWLLALGLLAIYAQALSFGLIQLDDPKHIFENGRYLQPTLSGLASFWTEPFFGLYIPVTYSFWWFLSLVSISPAWFHFANLALHVLNTLLVYHLLLRAVPKPTAEARLACAAGAFLFGAHPAQVESVAWISGMKDLLSCGFGLAAILAVFKMEEKGNQAFGLACAFFLLAMLSKPTWTMLPVWLVAFHFSVRRFSAGWKHLAVGLGLALVMGLLAKSLQPDAEVQNKVSWLLRPWVALDAIGFYAKQALIPWNYVLDYGRSPQNIIHWANFAWAGLLFLGLFRFKKLQPTLFLFLVPLLPVLGLIPFQFQVFSTVADRFLYFSLFGMAWLLVSTLRENTWRWKWHAVGALLLVFGVRSVMQVSVWQDDEKLSLHSLAYFPQSYLVHNNLAFYYFYIGRPNESVPHFKAAMQERPDVPELRRNYGMALVQTGRQEEGMREVRLAEEARQALSLRAASR